MRGGGPPRVPENQATTRSPGKVIRILLIIALVAVLFVLLRRVFAGSRVSVERVEEDKRPGRVAQMVRCEHCRLYVPEAAALRRAERYYCCAEHRDADGAGGDGGGVGQGSRDVDAADKGAGGGSAG